MMMGIKTETAPEPIVQKRRATVKMVFLFSVSEVIEEASPQYGTSTDV